MEETLRKRLEIGFGVFLLAVFVFLFLVGLSFPPRPRELPNLVLGGGIVLVIVHLYGVIRRETVPGKVTGAHLNWTAIFQAFGSMILYLVSSYFIGMTLSSAIIVFGCGMAFGAKSKTKMAIVAVLVVIAVHLLFTVALNVPLYHGRLFGEQ